MSDKILKTIEDALKTFSELMKIMIEKLSSGKFLFTMATAYVFIWGVRHTLIPAERMVEIILIVIYAYFNKVENPKPPTNGGVNV